MSARKSVPVFAASLYCYAKVDMRKTSVGKYKENKSDFTEYEQDPGAKTRATAPALSSIIPQKQIIIYLVPIRILATITTETKTYN